MVSGQERLTISEMTHLSKKTLRKRIHLSASYHQNKHFRMTNKRGKAYLISVLNPWATGPICLRASAKAAYDIKEQAVEQKCSLHGSKEARKRGHASSHLVISTLRTLRQENCCELEASLGYIAET